MKMFLVLLVVVASMILTGCEVTKQIDNTTSVTMSYRDAATIVSWLDHNMNDHDD